MIRPGDQVTITVSWDSIVVPDAQIAAWLNANPWAVRLHFWCEQADAATAAPPQEDQ